MFSRAAIFICVCIVINTPNWAHYGLWSQIRECGIVALDYKELRFLGHTAVYEQTNTALYCRKFVLKKSEGIITEIFGKR